MSHTLLKSGRCLHILLEVDFAVVLEALTPAFVAFLALFTLFNVMFSLSISFPLFFFELVASRFGLGFLRIQWSLARFY